MGLASNSVLTAGPQKPVELPEDVMTVSKPLLVAVLASALCAVACGSDAAPNKARIEVICMPSCCRTAIRPMAMIT